MPLRALKDLSCQAQAALYAIDRAARANTAPHERVQRVARLTVRQLAADVGCSRPTARRALRELREACWVHVSRGVGGGLVLMLLGSTYPQGEKIFPPLDGGPSGGH